MNQSAHLSHCVALALDLHCRLPFATTRDFFRSNQLIASEELEVKQSDLRKERENYMKKTATIMTMALMLCAMVGTMALAKGKFHTITFDQNTMVNGTTVKKGEYETRFNEQTGEFAILDGNRVIVTTTAKEEKLGKKAHQTSYDLKATDNGPVLTKVTFGGDRYSLMIGNAQAAEGQ
jgi:hypothetical protein